MPDMQNRSELLAQLNHVGGQLLGRNAEKAASPLLEELLDLASTLNVPTDMARDDSHIFLSAPEKIAEATWTQCGGILYALNREQRVDASAIAAGVAQRIFRLAPSHH